MNSPTVLRISAGSRPGLYRHYASKYGMFAGAVLALGQQLVDCTDFVDAVPDSELAAGPAAVLGRVVDALIEVTLANSESGGLYRWQARYLHAADQAYPQGWVRKLMERTLFGSGE